MVGRLPEEGLGLENSKRHPNDPNLVRAGLAREVEKMSQRERRSALAYVDAALARLAAISQQPRPEQAEA